MWPPHVSGAVPAACGPPPVVMFITPIERDRQAVQDFSDLQGPVIHGAAFSWLRISEITCSLSSL